VETALPIMLDAMLHKRIESDVLVRTICENPARILGLREKGALLPGRDADIVLVDPNATWVVDESKLHSKAGWSPFHGRRLKGRLRMTMLRGTVIARDGELVGAGPRGRQVRRTRTSREETPVRNSALREPAGIGV
jgi:dihydroorotase-like cyclic amidohydrolase